MEEIREAISKIKLPITLPPDALINDGKQVRLVHIDALFEVLAPNLQEYIDKELTITNVSSSTFALPLTDGRYLFVKVKAGQITALEIVSRY